MKLEILKKEQISDGKFNEFFSLLQKALLKEEYRSFNAQKALIQKEAYQILFCSIKEKTVGVMALWHLENFVFIEHFVVDENFRNKGIGSKMLQFIKNCSENNVILEVELPYNEINKRRILFYERNGFNYNDFEYYQIPLNKGDEPLPLRIMSYPDSLSEEKFETIRKNLIKDVYNSSNCDKTY